MEGTVPSQFQRLSSSSSEHPVALSYTLSEMIGNDQNFYLTVLEVSTGALRLLEILDFFRTFA